jgi:alpha-L-fucosidase 2
MTTKFIIALYINVFTMVWYVQAQPKKDNISVAIDWRSFLENQDMKWTKMPLNYYEGPYVGNGLLGTVFFKDTIVPNTIAFEIGRTDVYDHRTPEQIKDKYPWPKVRLPIGKLLLTSKGTIQSVNFRTHLWDAEVTGTIVTDKGSLDLTCYAPTNEKIIILKYKGHLGEIESHVSFRPEQGNSARPPRRPMAGKVYEPNPPFTVSKQDDIQIITQPLLNGDDYATAWNQKKEINGSTSVYITVANKWAENRKPFYGSNLLAVKQLKSARKKDEMKMMQNHRKWWHTYYTSSFISIPDKRMESYYWMQLYRMASAGRPDQPVIDLLGPWYKPSVWLSIWANLNLQLTYYSTGVTNHLDMEEPYFKMIEKHQNQLIHNVPKEFQNDCAALQTVVMFNDLSGNVFLTKDSATKQRMSLIALPWIMQQFYIHYRMTMDEKRLQKSIYPLMKRAFNVYLRVMHKGEDGKYHLPLTFSDEFGEDKDVSMNLALAKWGFKTLISCAEKFKIKETALPQWKEFVQNIASYPVDERGIKIGQNLSFDRPHRHYSHLFSIFPLYEMNIDDNKDQLVLMEKSINNYTNLDGDNCMYKFSGASSLWSALGNGDTALQWLQRSLQILPYKVPTVSVNGFYSEHGWPTFESPIASTRSLLDMMLQSWGNTIRVFPAMPAEWKEAVFNNLRAEGGFLISAKRENGKTSWVHVKSLYGEPFQLRVSDWKEELNYSFDSSCIKKISEGLYRITLKKGESMVIHPKDKKSTFTVEPTTSPDAFHWGLN